MMSEQGIYYWHVNGALIYKRDLPGTAADIRESDMARALWFMDTGNRADAWKICVEGLSAGVDRDRIMELAEKWGCNNEDAPNYAEYLGLTLDMDGNQWCAKPSWFLNLAEHPAGFGDTELEAFADLATKLGYKPSKMWGNTFEGLCKPKETTDATT
jgi:hypothetical protein